MYNTTTSIYVESVSFTRIGHHSTTSLTGDILGARIVLYTFSTSSYKQLYMEETFWDGKNVAEVGENVESTPKWIDPPPSRFRMELYS